MHRSMVASLCALCLSSYAWADGSVNGLGRFERIKGRPGDYIQLYEWNLYLAPDGGTSIGQSRRLGACSEYGSSCTAGYYQIEAPAGWYTATVTQPLFFARPTVVRDIQVIDGQLRTYNVDLNLDYSCWHEQDGNWSWGSPRYQTFEATGTSIVRIAWKLAGWSCDRVRASILEDNGGPVYSWPQVGPSKTAEVGYGDAWVGFRSGAIPTTPHKKYALRLVGEGGTQDFGIRHRPEDGNGYALGAAYDANGNMQNVDLHATIFSDNDGTVVPYIDMTPGNVESLAGNTGTWGQTFKATGVALASTDCFIAGDGTWDVDIEYRIRANGPGGAQVGPTKIAQATYQAATAGLVGVSYAPGEVPLTPGNTYFIEMARASGSPAFVAYKFSDQGANGYPDGSAYWNGTLQNNVDLEMTIIEYKPWYSPTLVNPSFEDYGGYLDGWSITRTGGGPDNPPLSDGAFGIHAPDGDHFAGKVTSGGTFDFTMGQVIEVGDYPPGLPQLAYQLNAQVLLHSRDSAASPVPGNVHQIWEIGWNDDGSLPAGVNRCDNYQTIIQLDGNATGNDATTFTPITASGGIVTPITIEYVALRVRIYNDSPLAWSLNNIDQVELLIPPAGPEIAFSPGELTPTTPIYTNPSDVTFDLFNNGAASYTYTISDDAGWLSVHPSTGSVAAETDTITVSFSGVDAFLAGDYSATITITSPEAWNSPQTIPVTLTVASVSPDIDGDGDVDIEDFGWLQRCYTGPGITQSDPSCAGALIDEDDDVDQDDYLIFDACISGPGNLATPGCDE